MGLFNFDNLPVNTLVGADWKTFSKVSRGEEIGRTCRSKYLLTMYVCAIMNPFYKINEAKYSSLMKKLASGRLSERSMESPVFIIGHWRSGTTFVHNVLSKDPQFGYCTTYETVFPHLMLWGRPFFRWCMKSLMPSSRPADSLELNPDQPQEEEFALANLTPCSYYHFWSFPKNIPEFREKYLLMRGLSSEEKEEFSRNVHKIMELAMYTAPERARRFLSKNPPHTARVRELLEIYPDAKFIYLVRNPYTVFKSTMNFIGNTLRTTALQELSKEELEKQILITYKDMYDKYETDKSLVPQGNLIEVRFEDFEKDPIAEAGRIYSVLGLGDFASACPLMESYIAGKRGFHKNKYVYDAHTMAVVDENWHEAVAKWGYK